MGIKEQVKVGQLTPQEALHEISTWKRAAPERLVRWLKNRPAPVMKQAEKKKKKKKVRRKKCT